MSSRMRAQPIACNANPRLRKKQDKREPVSKPGCGILFSFLVYDLSGQKVTLHGIASSPDSLPLFPAMTSLTVGLWPRSICWNKPSSPLCWFWSECFIPETEREPGQCTLHLIFNGEASRSSHSFSDVWWFSSMRHEVTQKLPYIVSACMGIPLSLSRSSGRARRGD